LWVRIADRHLLHGIGLNLGRLRRPFFFAPNLLPRHLFGRLDPSHIRCSGSPEGNRLHGVAMDAEDRAVAVKEMTG